MNSARGRPLELRVLLLAPTRRDARMTGTILERAGIACTLCATLEIVCREWMAGAGATLLTEESLAPDRVDCLVEALARQPAWSDFPILVLTRGGADSPVAAHAMERFGNVLLLERPVRIAALVSAVRTALRARRRQYQIRDHLAEQRRAEARLQQFNESLEQRVAERTALAEEQAGQLRALASALTQTEQRERRRLAQLLHDHLQQLLVAAKMNLSALAHRISEPEHRAALKRVDSLLGESVEAARSLTIELSPPILESGLGASLKWLSRWMQEKHGLRVELDAEQQAEPASEELRLLLFEAVRELLFNVVKHAHVSEARVRTSISDDSLQIVVSDPGLGFRAKDAAEERSSSRGFGLFSIAQRLKAVGGELDIDSTPGAGTRVMVRVPQVRRKTVPASVHPDAVHDPGPAAPAEPSGGHEKIRVLLADDHQIVREGLVILLADEPDMEVVAEASDGMMALETARHLRPDVVVLDINMPQLNGIEATRRIVAEFPHIRVIGLSMHEASDQAQAMADAGAAAYLSKGGPSEDLVAAIRRSVRRSTTRANCEDSNRAVGTRAD